MRKFLHVGLNFAIPRDFHTLEPVFNTADDWLRYAANAWIVSTSESPEVWAEKLRTAISEKDTILIFEIDPSSKWGYANSFVWNWLGKYRRSGL